MNAEQWSAKDVGCLIGIVAKLNPERLTVPGDPTATAEVRAVAYRAKAYAERLHSTQATP